MNHEESDQAHLLKHLRILSFFLCLSNVKIALALLRKKKKEEKVLSTTKTIQIDGRKGNANNQKNKRTTTKTPFLDENNMAFELENFCDNDYYDDDDDDERCHGLLIRQKTSYSTRSEKPSPKAALSARQQNDTVKVEQAIACALKGNPKIFQFAQKKIQYIPPSIKHLAVCDALCELDLHGNQLKDLPNEIEKLKSIETCNLGKIKIKQRFSIILRPDFI